MGNKLRGIATNGYSTGVQVPVSVVIFGIAGGISDFLYYTATEERELNKITSASGEQAHQTRQKKKNFLFLKR